MELTLRYRRTLEIWEEFAEPPLHPENFKKRVEHDIELHFPEVKKSTERRELINEMTRILAYASNRNPSAHNAEDYASMLHTLASHYRGIPRILLAKAPYASTPSIIKHNSRTYRLPKNIEDALFNQWFLKGSEESVHNVKHLAMYLNNPDMIKKHGPEHTIHWNGRSFISPPGRTGKPLLTISNYRAFELPWLDDPEINPEWIFPLPQAKTKSYLKLLSHKMNDKLAPVKSVERLHELCLQRHKMHEAYMAVAEENKKKGKSFRSSTNLYQNIFDWAERTGLASKKIANTLLQNATDNENDPLNEEARIRIASRI